MSVCLSLCRSDRAVHAHPGDASVCRSLEVVKLLCLRRIPNWRSVLDWHVQVCVRRSVSVVCDGQSWSMLHTSSQSSIKWNLSAAWKITQTKGGSKMCMYYSISTHTTTQQQPFYGPLSELLGWAGSRGAHGVIHTIFWILWFKGKITETDPLIIRLDATTSGLSVPHLHHPDHFYARCHSCCNPPNLFWLGTDTNRVTGFHRSLKVLEFFLIFKALKVLENRSGR